MFHVGQGTSWPMSDTLLPSHCHANTRAELQSGRCKLGQFFIGLFHQFVFGHSMGPMQSYICFGFVRLQTID